MASNVSIPLKYLLDCPDEGPETVKAVAMVLGILDLVTCIYRFAKNNELMGLKHLLKGLKNFCK
jgi:hypothetical protein